MQISQIINRREELDQQIKALKEELEQVDMKLDAALSPIASELRAQKGKDTGSVTFERDGFEIVANLPKKVKWDNGKLADLAKKMSESGDDPTQWLKLTYGVDERSFTSWPDGIKAAFASARTVETGKPTYKFKQLEG